MCWRTRATVPCGGISPSSRPAAEVVDQRVEIGGGHPVAVAVVDLQARRLGARRLALGVLEREQAVGGGAAGLDAELLLGVVHQLVGASCTPIITFDKQFNTNRRGKGKKNYSADVGSSRSFVIDVFDGSVDSYSEAAHF